MTIQRFGRTITNLNRYYILKRFNSDISKGEPTGMMSNRINFDVSHYVDLLKAEGFTTSESNGLIALISQVVDESMLASTKSLVTKKDHRQSIGQSELELNRIRTDIHSLEQKDFGMLKSSLESIKADVESHKNNLTTDLSKVHSGVRLDLNLEKSRILLESQELKNQLKEAEEKIDLQMKKLEDRLTRIRDGTKKGMMSNHFMNNHIGILTVLSSVLVGYKFAIHYENTQNNE
ncbi:hypothetical protein HDV02_001277 [Globomyces sp. JEL0801]|nr:hypothetical protein HDV02_001277 [Globomyces sp. JEL0801]